MDSDKSWIKKEFESLCLGDKRLDNRMIDIATNMSQGPSLPLNQVSDDWGSVKASYRFFNNEKVTPRKIISPHIESTIKRCLKYNYILVIQDTSVIDFSSHQKTVGLGKIGGQTKVKNKTQGIVMHSSMALSPDGVPLGLISNDIWTRKKAKDQSLNGEIDITDKESYKWVSAFEGYSSALEKKIPTITVCDREADFLNMFLTIDDADEKFVIRSFHNRNIGNRYNVKKMYEEVKKVSPFNELKTISVPIKDRSKHDPKRKRYYESATYRDAKVRIYLNEITITPSRKHYEGIKEKISVNHIFMEEIDPPSEGEKVQWHLVSNLPVASFEDAWSIIQIYRKRWNIETFFKVLKSACKIESCRLGFSKRLERFISLKCVIAWRLFWLTYLTKESPKAECTLAFSDLEWKTLYHRKHKTKKLPCKIPSIKDANTWLAQLGGYLNRTSDGPPGILAIWKGWIRLQDMVSIQEIVQ